MSVFGVTYTVFVFQNTRIILRSVLIMTGSVKVIEEDSQFQPELSNAGSKLVVVDFYATWCGPCRVVAPIFEQLAAKYQRAVFLKVDVDKCQETASSQGVSAMPTFNFYRSKTKVDSLRGADPGPLEEKIKKWYGAEEEEDDVGVKGHMDLSTFFQRAESECLNESDEHPFDHCLTSKGGFLESDCDEQLIMSISFNQAVKLHSLKISAPEEKGPKTIKIFINQPRTLDFDTAEGMEPMQAFDLKPEELQGGLIPLRYVKFQTVNSLTIFIKDNQQGTETTQIDHLMVIGSPVNTTNMSDFKRVAGKKGESH